MQATKAKTRNTYTPPDIGIGDIIAAAFATGSSWNSAVEAVARAAAADEETVQIKTSRQITPATEAEMDAIIELGEEAAEIDDRIKELLGGLPAQLKKKKDELLEKMLAHGLKEVPLQGRPAIQLDLRNEKRKTKKELVRVLGVEEGNRVWSLLGSDQKESVTIPPRNPPEA